VTAGDPVADRLAALTPAQRAALRGRLRAATARPTAAAAPARPARPPLSPNQTRMWEHQRDAPDSPAFAVSYAVHLHGPLDRGALGRALDRVVARHEALRTRYPAAGGRPYQRVEEPGPVELPFRDLSGSPDPAAEAGRRALEHARTALDPAAGPVLRAALLRVGDGHHVLPLAVHHISTDGLSMEILAAELTALYAAGRDGAPDPLPRPAPQYADFALWQHRELAGGVLARPLEHWVRELADAPDTALPTDRARPAGGWHGGAGGNAVARLSPAQHERLAAFARAGRVPLLPVLLAAAAHVLRRATGRDDLLLGSSFGNRTRPEWAGLVGVVANTLPLRIRLPRGLSPRELVTRTARVARVAHGAQEVPLAAVLAARPGGTAADPPPYRSVLTLQRTPGPLAGGGLRVDAAALQLGTARFELSFWPCPAPDGGLDVLAEYAADLFDADRISDLLAELMHVLGRFADSPDTPLETV
jgi:hypothetical protein